MKITKQEFAVAKKAVRGIADSSEAHRVAMETLTASCPKAGLELVQDMAWQVVLATR